MAHTIAFTAAIWLLATTAACVRAAMDQPSQSREPSAAVADDAAASADDDARRADDAQAVEQTPKNEKPPTAQQSQPPEQSPPSEIAPPEETMPPGEENEAAQRDPLARIEQQMRSSQVALAQRDAGPQTRQLQKQIVDDLDELMRRVRQNSRPLDSPSGGSSSQQKPSVGASNQASGDIAADSRQGEQSTERLGAADSQPPVEMLTGRSLLTEVWGRLPNRPPRDMLQSAGERFLPKYELEIERYFRRLMEEQDR